LTFEDFASKILITIISRTRKTASQLRYSSGFSQQNSVTFFIQRLKAVFENVLFWPTAYIVLTVETLYKIVSLFALNGTWSRWYRCIGK